MKPSGRWRWSWHPPAGDGDRYSPADDGDHDTLRQVRVIMIPSRRWLGQWYPPAGDGDHDTLRQVTVIMILSGRWRWSWYPLAGDGDHDTLWQVTVIMIPEEIAWAATVQWVAGDALCRLFSFFRIFGHYLSSFILVCISIDRYGHYLSSFLLVCISIDRYGQYLSSFTVISTQRSQPPLDEELYEIYIPSFIQS